MAPLAVHPAALDGAGAAVLAADEGLEPVIASSGRASDGAAAKVLAAMELAETGCAAVEMRLDCRFYVSN